MKARHEFVSDKKFYDYLKIYMSVEFVKAAIINDDGDTETICTEVVTLSNKLIEELKKDNKEIGETK
jgi:transaldolase